MSPWSPGPPSAPAGRPGRTGARGPGRRGSGTGRGPAPPGPPRRLGAPRDPKATRRAGDAVPRPKPCPWPGLHEAAARPEAGEGPGNEGPNREGGASSPPRPSLAWVRLPSAGPGVPPRRPLPEGRGLRGVPSPCASPSVQVGVRWGGPRMGPPPAAPPSSGRGPGRRAPPHGGGKGEGKPLRAGASSASLRFASGCPFRRPP